MNGILVVDKPQGWTSHDVVAKLRGILRERRIGHGGTLDPMATGVLTVFVGRATRVVEFAEHDEKEYEALLRLGLTTDTQDSTGQVLSRSEVLITREELEAVLPQFRGEILQIPPMYSALKHNGKKLYELARAGQEVERPPRKIIIRELELLDQPEENCFSLRVRCSKGTYIRTLCHDLGQALGCGGVMAALRRTRAGGFSLEQAISLEEAARLGEAALLPLERYFESEPPYRIAEEWAEKRCRNGAVFPAEGEPGRYRIYGTDGSFLALGQLANGQMATIKSFFEVNSD